MGRLRRPDLPPGALADLVQELHALHARAGQPSMRELAKGQQFSYTTVHDLFTRTITEPPRLPVLLTVVERLAMLAQRMNVEETLDKFDELWRAAAAAPFEEQLEDTATAAAPQTKSSLGDAPTTSDVLLTANEKAVLESGERAEEPPSMRLAARAMTKELFFLADSAAPLHDVAAELRRAGYLVRSQPRDLDGRWSLMAYSAASELTDSDLATLDGIADRCGVTFDGWGTYVGPPELDDGPGKSPAARTERPIESPVSTDKGVCAAPSVERRILGHTGSVCAVATAELDGRQVVVSGSSDKTVRVWDVATGEPVGSPLTGHTGAVSAVAIAQLHGRPVVVSGGSEHVDAGTDHTVRVWDLATGQPVGSPFAGHRGSVCAVATVQLDGRPVVVSGGFDGTVRVWDLATREPVWSPFPRRGPLPRRSGIVRSLAAAQLDGRLVVVVRFVGDNAVRVWDLATGQPVGSPLTGHTGSVNRFAVAQLHGRPVVCGSSDNTGRVWDLATGRLVGWPFIGHTKFVEVVATAELDGRPVVISGSDDKTVRMWDLATGQLVGSPFTGHTDFVSALATAELDGGPVVISGSGDKTIRVWDLAARAHS